MIEVLFLPNIINNDDYVINKEKLDLLNTHLDISKCNTNIKERYLENHSKYLNLDENLFYLNFNNDNSFLIEIPSPKQKYIFKILGIGFIETKKYRDYVKNIQLNFNEPIESLIEHLMFEFERLSCDSKEGFSIIIYCNINNFKYLIFGRDQQGDSSLIMSIGNCGKEIILSNIESELLSFKEDKQSIEIPISGFFLLNIIDFKLKYFSWNKKLPYMTKEFWNNDEKIILSPISEDSKKLLNSLRSVFYTSIEDKFTFINKGNSIFIYIGMLFSGGLDSTVLLYLLLEWLFLNINEIEKNIFKKFSNKENLLNIDSNNIFFIIELINTTFVPTEAPDRITGLSSYYEILNLFNNQIQQYNRISIRFVCVDNEGGILTKTEKEILKCISPCRTHLDFNIGGALYFSLKGEGFLLNSDTFKEDWWQNIISNQDNLNIWNDIFEKKLNIVNNSNEINKKELDENKMNLNKKCPYCSFKQHLKCQNQCCKSCCRKIQQNLLKPINGQIFYACRIHKMKTADYSIIPSTQRYIDANNYYLKDSEYEKILFDNEKKNIDDLIIIYNKKKYYKVQSKYLLIGTGADEYLGGYGRHLTAKKHCGYIGIRNEMLFDISRLWIRNLGRDYRIALYNNKKLFSVFLQRSVIETIGKLNFDNICVYKFEVTKPLLRYIAKDLGIEFSSRFKKRAVQFGTRSSRQTNLKHFDSNRKATADAFYVPINKI